jgi:hypothetical protein
MTIETGEIYIFKNEVQMDSERHTFYNRKQKIEKIKSLCQQLKKLSEKGDRYFIEVRMRNEKQKP